MKNLDEIASKIQAGLDEKDTVREIAIKSSRAIIRLSGSAVHALHRGEDADATLAEAYDEVQRLKSLLQEHPDIGNSGLVEDAMQEMAEAAIIVAISKGEDLPEPNDINVTDTAYLLGLGDSLGELRRFALTALRNGKVDSATVYLEMMEEMFTVLMRFDYPDAIVAVRRKQDVARSLLEKTRGEVAVAVSSKALADKIEALDRKL
jgi:translin